MTHIKSIHLFGFIFLLYTSQVDIKSKNGFIQTNPLTYSLSKTDTLRPFYYYGPITKADSAFHKAEKDFKLAVANLPKGRKKRKKIDKLANVITKFHEEGYRFDLTKSPICDSIAFYIIPASDTITIIIDGITVFHNVTKDNHCCDCNEALLNKFMYYNITKKETLAFVRRTVFYTFYSSKTKNDPPPYRSESPKVG
jgi:hypothetical protein